MNTKHLQFTFLFFLFPILLSAQVKDLPFSTDWLTTAEQNEWTQYRLTPSVLFDWTFNPGGTLTHDYPVGNTQLDTIRDWMVSPPINFYSSSKINLRVNVFTFIGITPDDYFGIWFSDGSPDPSDGDYQEIVDLTGLVDAANFRDTLGIEIPFTADEGHIAFVYEAVDNWFTIGLDSIGIISDSILLNTSTNFLEKEIKVYPNPVADFALLSIDKNLSINNSEVAIINNLGQTVFLQSINEHLTTLNLTACKNGLYHYQVRQDGIILKNGKLFLK